MAVAQGTSAKGLAGNWSGELKVGGASLPLVLHLSLGPEAKLHATLDSPAQAAYGIPVQTVELKGSSFRLEMPAIHATYNATVSADGKTISGTWLQSKPLPLVLKQTATAAELAQVTPSPIDGDWAGVLRAGGTSLRLLVHLHSAPGGKIDCTMDSLDQGAMGIACGDVQLQGNKLSFSVPAVRGHYTGMLSADGESLSGTWDQGAPLALDLRRQAPAHNAPTSPAPARPPVPLDHLQPILDKEFAPIIAAWKNAGVVVGIVDRGRRKILAYGIAKPDSIFEIGSLTKTFTGLTLAQMVEQKMVTLDEPVRDLLPPGTVAKPASGPEITLRDLATQHSGLPRLPDNLRPRSPADPYADYSARDLYQYLAQHGVGRPEQTDFLYSNLGFGLLGQALADKAGKSYGDLVRQQVTGPLEMKDTVVKLSAAQEPRLIQGYTGAHDRARQWTFQAMAGAGALLSTATDLLTYAEAYLHPDKLPPASSGPASTLAQALQLAQRPEADAGPMKIALAWLIRPETDTYWHDGGTAGYSSLIIFEPKRERAIVVLYNCLDIMPGRPQLTTRVAANIQALMDGEPVPSIGNE